MKIKTKWYFSAFVGLLLITALFFAFRIWNQPHVTVIKSTTKYYPVPIKNQNDYSLEYEKPFAYFISVPMHGSPKEIIEYESRHFGKFIKKDSAYYGKIGALGTQWDVKITFPDSSSIEAELKGSTSDVKKLLSYFNEYNTMDGSWRHHDTIHYSGHVPSMHMDHDSIIRKAKLDAYDFLCGGKLKRPIRFYFANITVDTITRHAILTLK